MTPAASASDDAPGKDMIAVPITNECLSMLLERKKPSIGSQQETAMEWQSLVEGLGVQEMPFSTSQFAKKKNK